MKVGIIGASGFAGYELIKILTKHPQTELKVLNSKSFEGKKVSELYPDYQGDETFTNYSIEEMNKMELDCVFLAVPPTKAFLIVPKLNCKCVDLSADYRFKDVKLYEQIYKTPHQDLENNSEAVYGLPELFKDKIKDAKVIGNPGCYSTVCLLTSMPIVDLANYTIFDVKSGYSGAGKSSKFATDHDNTIKENIVAYKLTNHRHKYEIEQFVGKKISFTPHVIDAFQGMMSTTHVMLKENVTKEQIIKKFEEYYKDKPFVKIIKDKIPEIKDIQDTNYCHIGGFEIDENNQLIIIGVIDNLIKGASGQAVQNMNVMFNFDETEGLV